MGFEVPLFSDRVLQEGEGIPEDLYASEEKDHLHPLGPSESLLQVDLASGLQREGEKLLLEAASLDATEEAQARSHGCLIYHLRLSFQEDLREVLADVNSVQEIRSFHLDYSLFPRIFTEIQVRHDLGIYGQISQEE